MFLRIVEWETPSALQLPLSALFRQGEGWAVFVVAEGTARRVEVEVGRRNGRTAEVLSGLQEGDRVVTHPNNALADGARVVERAAF